VRSIPHADSLLIRPLNLIRTASHKLYKALSLAGILMDEVIVKLKVSRKAYCIEYACGVLLLALFLLLLWNGVALPEILRKIIPLIILIIFLTPEVQRVMTRYTLTPTKIVIIHGILKKNKKNVYYHPLAFVPDLNVKQGRLERLLDIGTIFIRSGQETTFELKNINRPHEILEMLEELIRGKKKSEE